jgi:hypothetical protein
MLTFDGMRQQYAVHSGPRRQVQPACGAYLFILFFIYLFFGSTTYYLNNIDR